MSTQQSKPSSIDDEGHPESGQRLVAHYPAAANSAEIEPEGGFSATCENTSLSDWIQLVQMNRRDAVIGIKHHDGRKALLWCRQGDIIDAWCDGAIGEDAVFRALAWESGQVSVAFAPFERERRIEAATPALLLRAAYQRDSGVRSLKPPARAPGSAPSVPPSVLATLSPLVVRSPSVTRGSRATLSPLLAPQAEPRSTSETAASPATKPDPAPAAAKGQKEQPALESSAAPSEPSATPKRRKRQRAWLAGLALGLLPIIALTASWSVTPKGDASSGAAPRKLTVRADPARPAPAPRELPAKAAPPETVPAPEPAPPVREPTRAVRAAPASLRAVLSPTRRAPAPVSKPVAQAKPSLQVIDERAPRVQIIDEPQSKIEVIE